MMELEYKIKYIRMISIIVTLVFSIFWLNILYFINYVRHAFKVFSNFLCLSMKNMVEVKNTFNI